MNDKTIATEAKIIHVFVDVTKTDHRKIEFQADHATGREIKEKANVPMDDDLARREQGQLIKVENNETVTLKEGEHFFVFPAGTIS